MFIIQVLACLIVALISFLGYMYWEEKQDSLYLSAISLLCTGLSLATLVGLALSLERINV